MMKLRSKKSWTVPQVTNGSVVQVAWGYSQKTGVLNIGEAKISTSPKKGLSKT